MTELAQNDPACITEELRMVRDQIRRFIAEEVLPNADRWEEEGALSLGRVRNYDWMHVQFARL